MQKMSENLPTGSETNTAVTEKASLNNKQDVEDPNSISNVKQRL